MKIYKIFFLLFVIVGEQRAENFTKKKSISLTQEIGKKTATVIKKTNDLIVCLAGKEQELIAQEFALCQLDEGQEIDNIAAMDRNKKQAHLAALNHYEHMLDQCKEILNQKSPLVTNNKK